MHSKIALAALLLILISVNWSIAGNEKHLREGRAVYLQLAPVDPRSLMQGDYMALRFRVANQVRSALRRDPSGQDRRELSASDGHVIVTLDANKVASFKALHKGQATAPGEVLLRYRIRNHKVKFATNAFFFQEGEGKLYESARYGLFRVDEQGELLLVSMHDEHLKKLGNEEGG